MASYLIKPQAFNPEPSPLTPGARGVVCQVGFASALFLSQGGADLDGGACPIESPCYIDVVASFVQVGVMLHRYR
jgi:hypothetical protein